MQLSSANFVIMSIKRKTKSVETVLSIFEHNHEAISVVSLIDLLQEK